MPLLPEIMVEPSGEEVAALRDEQVGLVADGVIAVADGPGKCTAALVEDARIVVDRAGTVVSDRSDGKLGAVEVLQSGVKADLARIGCGQGSGRIGDTCRCAGQR
jgi:hypothetical protein